MKLYHVDDLIATISKLIFFISVWDINMLRHLTVDAFVLEH